MQKRGQAFRFFIIIFISVMIIVFGFTAIKSMREASFKASLATFRQNLKTSVAATASDKGSVNEENYKLPTGVEKVYFIDNKKNISAFSDSLSEYPDLVQAVLENTDENVFVVRDGEIVDSFNGGDIELNKPYFVCTDTKYGDADLYLGGTGIATELVNRDCASDCTIEKVNVDESMVDLILNEAKAQNCKGCPTGDLTAMKTKYMDAANKVGIYRRCNCGRQPGQAIVEIRLKPQPGGATDYTLIERIPKEYVADLSVVYENMTGSFDSFKIFNDPLIMWHFTNLVSDTVIKYTLNTENIKYCADLLQTIGYSNAMPTEAFIPDGLNLILPFHIIPIAPNDKDENVFKSPLFKSVTANDRNPQQIKNFKYEIARKGLSTYGTTATYTSGGKSVKCQIKNDKHVKCEVDAGYSAASPIFTVRVTDTINGATATDDFTVDTGGCGGFTSQSTCPLSTCDWCPKCDVNNKVNKFGIDLCVNKGDCKASDYLVGTDADGDGKNIECALDCADDPLDAKSKYIFKGNPNTNCDCDKTGDGIDKGTAEICLDTLDQDCDGGDSACTAYKICIAKPADTSASNFDNECAKWDDEEKPNSGYWDSMWYGIVAYHQKDAPPKARYWVDKDTGDDSYKCYEDFVTPCMINPTCPAGYWSFGPYSCTVGGTRFRYKYLKNVKRNCASVTEDECDDFPGSYLEILHHDCTSDKAVACYYLNFTDWSSNPAWPQGNIFKAVEICNPTAEECGNGLDDDCDNKLDCWDEACPCGEDEVCEPDANCKPQCDLLDIHWSTTSANEEDLITAYVFGDNQCSGKDVRIEVWRNPFLTNFTTKFSSCGSTGCTTSKTFPAPWTLGLGLPDPQKFYIRANVTWHSENTSLELAGISPDRVTVTPINKKLKCYKPAPLSTGPTFGCTDSNCISKYGPDWVLKDTTPFILGSEFCNCVQTYWTTCQLNPTCNLNDVLINKIYCLPCDVPEGQCSKAYPGKKCMSGTLLDDASCNCDISSASWVKVPSKIWNGDYVWAPSLLAFTFTPNPSCTNSLMFKFSIYENDSVNDDLAVPPFAFSLSKIMGGLGQWTPITYPLNAGKDLPEDSNDISLEYFFNASFELKSWSKHQSGSAHICEDKDKDGKSPYKDCALVFNGSAAKFDCDDTAKTKGYENCSIIGNEDCDALADCADTVDCPAGTPCGPGGKVCQAGGLCSVPTLPSSFTWDEPKYFKQGSPMNFKVNVGYNCNGKKVCARFNEIDQGSNDDANVLGPTCQTCSGSGDISMSFTTPYGNLAGLESPATELDSDKLVPEYQLHITSGPSTGLENEEGISVEYAKVCPDKDGDGFSISDYGCADKVSGSKIDCDDNDVSVKPGTPFGLCGQCDAAGSGNKILVSDDSACGVSGIISCSGYYFQPDPAVVDGNKRCASRADITINRCEGIGDCKDANSNYCTNGLGAEQYTCGTCKYIDDCSGTDLGTCKNYPVNTPCSGGTCDGNGNCLASCVSPCQIKPVGAGGTNCCAKFNGMNWQCGCT